MPTPKEHQYIVASSSKKGDKTHYTLQRKDHKLPAYRNPRIEDGRLFIDIVKGEEKRDLGVVKKGSKIEYTDAYEIVLSR